MRNTVLPIRRAVGKHRRAYSAGPTQQEHDRHIGQLKMHRLADLGLRPCFKRIPKTMSGDVAMF